MAQLRGSNFSGEPSVRDLETTTSQRAFGYASWLTREVTERRTVNTKKEA